MRRVLSDVGHPGPTHVLGRQGKGAIVRDIQRYNQAAEVTPVLVVLDLDRDESCAPSYVRGLIESPSLQLQLRVAVHEIEAWLLADRERIAAHLHVSRQVVPLEPEFELDPKQVVVNLARRSRVRWIREELPPHPKAGRSVGPGYVDHMIAFVNDQWRPLDAAQYAPSLARAITSIRRAG